MGSALSVKHPFEVKEIEFDIISNNIKDVTLQVAIYRNITITEVLSQPILINIPEGRKQTIDAFEKYAASIGLKVKGVVIVSI